MVLKRLVEDDASTSGKLPYVDEYVTDNPDKIDVAELVEELVKRPKGWLIKTKVFIGFVFHGDKQGAYLSEALSSWYARTAVAYPLYAIPTEQGKTVLAVDDEMSPVNWSKDGNVYKVVTKKKKTGSGLKEKNSNPLLPTPSSPKKNSTTAEKRISDTDSYTEEPENQIPY